MAAILRFLCYYYETFQNLESRIEYITRKGNEEEGLEQQFLKDVLAGRPDFIWYHRVFFKYCKNYLGDISALYKCLKLFKDMCALVSSAKPASDNAKRLWANNLSLG